MIGKKLIRRNGNIQRLLKLVHKYFDESIHMDHLPFPSFLEVVCNMYDVKFLENCEKRSKPKLVNFI